jgi:hypothetical protein
VAVFFRALIAFLFLGLPAPLPAHAKSMKQGLSTARLPSKPFITNTRYSFRMIGHLTESGP